MPKDKMNVISVTDISLSKWNYKQVNYALRQAGLIGLSDNLLEEDRTVVNSAFMTWCLGVGNMSVEELSKFSELSPEEQEELVGRFLTDLEEYNVTSDDRAKNIEHAKWYGKMCSEAMNKIKEADIHFPTAEDLKDAKSREAYRDPKFFVVANIGKGWRKMTQSWRHVGNEIDADPETPFFDIYGKTEDYAKDQNVLQYSAAVGSIFDTNLSAKKQAYLVTVAKEEWIPLAAGKSFDEVAATDTLMTGSMAYGKSQAVIAGDFYGFDRLSDEEVKILLAGDSGKFPEHSENVSKETFENEKNAALSDVIESISIVDNVKSGLFPEKSKDVEANEINNYWMDAYKLNAKDLDKAAKLFDSLFKGMKAPQSKDPVEGFWVNGKPVKYYADSFLDDKKLSPQQRLKYEKAWIYFALHDSKVKQTIEYRPYPFMIKDLRDFPSMSAEELDQAAETFDSLFANLKNAEKNAMTFNGKEDITGNFRINGEPVDQTLSIIFDRNIKASDRVKFEKAYILRLLADPKQRERVTYEGFRIATYEEIVKKANAGISADRWRMESNATSERYRTVQLLAADVLKTVPHGVPESLQKEGFSITDDLGTISKEDLAAAVQIFDRTFAKLKDAERGALKLYGKNDITDNILYDGISVSSTVKAVLKDKNLSDEEIINYQKALVVHAMADPERKKLLGYEPFSLYRGQNGYTVTTGAQSEFHEFDNVTEWRRKQAENEIKQFEEKQKSNLLAHEVDNYQMMKARVLYAYRQRTGHWKSLNDITTIQNALSYHFNLNDINGDKYSFEYLNKNLPEKMKNEIKEAVDNILKAEADAEKKRNDEYKQRQQALEAEAQLARISDEQLASLRTKVEEMAANGIDLAEYMDSSDHGNYLSELGDDYLAEISPFDIAMGSTKGVAFEESIKKLPNKYFDEAMKALAHVEDLADKAKNDPAKYDYADEKAEDLAYWFNRHEYSAITENSLLTLKPVEERTNERGKKYTVFELTKDLNKVKLDRDKLQGLDVQAMEEAQQLFNDNKEAFAKVFDVMSTRVHAKYGVEAAWARDILNNLDKNEAGFEDPMMLKKLNRFRHLMYRIKVQDELVCKLGTDKNPVYVEPVAQLTDFTEEKAKLIECDVLDQCYKDLKEPSERVRRNSQEYMDLMDSIKNLKEVVRRDYGSDREAQDAYTREIEHVLNLANHYYVHKAADGIKNDATLDKIIAVERISKTLKTRYKLITGMEFTDNISKEASLFGEPKQVKEDLTGDQYVLGTAGGKINQMKEHIAKIKAAARKDRAEFLNRARKEVANEMADAKAEASAVLSGRKSVGPTPVKKGNGKTNAAANEKKSVRRNSVL